jgi:hypothetical protein
MVAVVADWTAEVVIGKVALEACEITTLPGKDTAVVSEESMTVAPADGAVAVSATVPPDGLPPITLDGLMLTEDRAAGAGAPVIGISLTMKASGAGA